jgi:hypothetical protein
MYNYVCAVDRYKRQVMSPYAIKIGVTANYENRFTQICQTALSEDRTADDFSVRPLFIIEGNYDRYIGERIEDVLRLYYLKKLGFDRGYKQDWIDTDGLPIEYDIQQEANEIEFLLQEWFPTLNIRVIFKNENPNARDTWRICSRWSTEIKYLFQGDE